VDVRVIYRTCPACGRSFAQPDDPGRKRRFCSDVCKQAAYRARKRASEQGRQRAQNDARRRAHEEHARRARDRGRIQERDRLSDGVEVPPYGLGLLAQAGGRYYLPPAERSADPRDHRLARERDRAGGSRTWQED
jgi:endogenous inhibitor of DNA gyrase (YacG/DUF329 family)